MVFTAKTLGKSLKRNVAPNAQNIECIARTTDGTEFSIKSVTSEYDEATGFNYPIIHIEEL